MEAMRLAFHKTCKALQLSANDDVFTEIVATRIIELAKVGERDPDRLCSKVLDTLSAPRKASDDKYPLAPPPGSRPQPAAGAIECGIP
jgi:hypothetical protein